MVLSIGLLVKGCPGSLVVWLSLPNENSDIWISKSRGSICRESLPVCRGTGHHVVHHVVHNVVHNGSGMFLCRETIPSSLHLVSMRIVVVFA